MQRLRGFPRRFRFPWRSTTQIRRDVADELAFHLAEKIDALQRKGLTLAEAREEALRQFGDLDTARKQLVADDRRGETQRLWLMMLDDLVCDARLACRSLWSAPGFTVPVIVAIALGIGVNTGIFTVLNGVLFRDLPAPDAHELVSIQQTVEGGSISARAGFGTFSTSEYRIYRDRAQTLSGVLAHGNPRRATLGGDALQDIMGMDVSCNYFAVLRQAPVLGRALTAADCEPGAAPVVVLGHGLWTTRFAADPEVLTTTIELNRQLFTVVGVAAEGTYGGSAYAVGYFAPISTEALLRPRESRYANDEYLWLHLIGRIRDGAGIAQVRSELGVIAAQIDRLDPGRSTVLEIDRATPITIPYRRLAIGAAAVLMAAFGSILLIACANVANLLLARGTARSQEIGIRLSLGASRARLVRQLLTESVLISVAGGIAGTVLAIWSFQALVALALPVLLPAEVPTLTLDFSPDFRVLSFAAALTLGTGMLFGLAPSLHASRPDLHSVVKQESAGAGSSRRGARLRGLFVGAQVALCMALMIGAGLLLRGLYATHATNIGFAYRDVAAVSLEFENAYEETELTAMRRSLLDEVEALPAVDAAALAALSPLGTEEFFTVPVRLPGQSEDASQQARLNTVTAGYFEVLEIPIARGRNFTAEEIADAARFTQTSPVIVSQATARNLWPAEDPIGQTLLLGDATLQVVGVAADAQVTTIGRTDPYYLYRPASTGQVLLVRGLTDFGPMASAIRAAAQSLSPPPTVRVRPLEANLAWWRGLSGTLATLGTSLGLLALVLASVGIYGVVSYSVARRYREIGIRRALGASARDVLALILRRTLRPVLIGAMIGVGAASAVSGILASILFGVSPYDPIGLGAAVLLVLGVTLSAAVAAAGPTMTADPTAALRYE